MSEKSSVTILTPTFNRKEEINKLYDSLKNQTDKNFVWLVIDDGSSDDTKSLFDEWQNEREFSVIYHYKANGGKHTALNFAYQYITTPLTFIVDSDDWLTEDAVETINRNYAENADNNELCGLSYLRKKNDGSGFLTQTGVPYDGMIESFTDCRINRSIGGDMAEVWKTDCLREFPFPEFEGEKFIGEDIVWISMAKKYKVVFYNEAIYVSDYLEGGLTYNRRKHNIQSPNGCMARAKVFLHANVKFKAKLKAMMQYIIYGKFAGKKYGEISRGCEKSLFCFVAYIPSLMIYKKWKKEYENAQ